MLEWPNPLRSGLVMLERGTRSNYAGPVGFTPCCLLLLYLRCNVACKLSGFVGWFWRSSGLGRVAFLWHAEGPCPLPCPFCALWWSAFRWAASRVLQEKTQCVNTRLYIVPNLVRMVHTPHYGFSGDASCLGPLLQIALPVCCGSARRYANSSCGDCVYTASYGKGLHFTACIILSTLF